MSIHIYTTDEQPATEYRISGVPHVFRASGHALARCARCRKLRRLRGMVVRAYYDQHVFSCAPGFGCRR